MATKNCPHCNKQVPVACKKCGCGHVFFATRRSANSVSRENPETAAEVSDQFESPVGDQHTPTRRSGRVTRERPNFYDALEYENQARRGEKEDSGDEECSRSSGPLITPRDRKYVSDQRFRKVLVTVGTTRFDELVKLVLGANTIGQFKNWKTTHVRIQKGNSIVAENVGRFDKEGISFEIYKFKPHLEKDMQWADLIISHAGAGTTIEALDLGKPLVVVPNRSLMDDHQLELASKLEEGKHAVLTSLDSFQSDMEGVKRCWFQSLPKRNHQKFTAILNSAVLGRKSNI